MTSASENGVVSLGVGNNFQITRPLGTSENIVFVATTQSMLFSAIEEALPEEKVLITGDWFAVGAAIEAINRDTGELTISDGGIVGGSEGSSYAKVGFVTAASNRVSLNPAVRTFLNTVQSQVTGSIEGPRSQGDRIRFG